jgi:hypothetical protein
MEEGHVGGQDPYRVVAPVKKMKMMILYTRMTDCRKL